MTKEIVLPIALADSVRYTREADGDTSIYVYKTKLNETIIIRKRNLSITALQKRKKDRKVFSAEFYPNSQLKGKVMHNEKGEIEGRVKYYYDDGRIKATGEFKSGKKVGTWEKFSENGYLSLLKLLISKVRVKDAEGAKRFFWPSTCLRMKPVYHKRSMNWKVWPKNGSEAHPVAA